MKKLYPRILILLFTVMALVSYKSYSQCPGGDIRSIELKGSGLRKFNFYTNPSNGIVGIKFADIFGGKLFIQVNNIQGQMVVKKEILVSRSSYCQIATLQREYSGRSWQM